VRGNVTVSGLLVEAPSGLSQDPALLPVGSIAKAIWHIARAWRDSRHCLPDQKARARCIRLCRRNSNLLTLRRQSLAHLATPMILGLEFGQNAGRDLRGGFWHDNTRAGLPSKTWSGISSALSRSALQALWPPIKSGMTAEPAQRSIGANHRSS